jgi:outer membrane protein
MQLVQLGTPESLLIPTLRSSGIGFVATQNELDAYARAGASENLLNTIRLASDAFQARTAAAASTTPPAAAGTAPQVSRPASPSASQPGVTRQQACMALRVASINFQQTVIQTGPFRQAYADLLKKYEPERQRLKALSDELSSLQWQTAAGSLNDRGTGPYSSTIDDKKRTLADDAAAAQKKFQADALTIFEPIASRVYDAVSVQARQQGFDLVVDSSVNGSGPFPLYKADSSRLCDIQAAVEAAVTTNGATSSATSANCLPLRVASINFQSAISQTEDFQRPFAEIQKKFEPQKQQIKALNDGIAGLQQQLAAQSGKLNSEEQASRRLAIDQDKRKVQDIVAAAQKEFQSAVQALYTPVATRVYAEMTTEAEQQSLDLVLDSGNTNEKFPLYKAESVSLCDIQTAVTDRFNRRIASSASTPAVASTPSSSVAPGVVGFANQDHASPADLLGTTWDYTDSSGRRMVIEFSAQGVLHCTATSGATYSDAQWSQEGQTVHFDFNNHYAKYTGQVQTSHMQGSALNVAGRSWTWSAEKR